MMVTQFKTLFSYCLILGLQLSLLPVVESSTSEKAEIFIVAGEWLALIDFEKYEDAYKELSSFTKDRLSYDEWIEFIEGDRQASWGLFLERELEAAARIDESWSKKPGHASYVMMFNTTFENEDEAVEALTLTKEGHTWRVLGYVVKKALNTYEAPVSQQAQQGPTGKE